MERGNKCGLHSLLAHLMNGLARGTGNHQDEQLTIVLKEPHREIIPCHIVTPGEVGNFLTVGSHTMRGAAGSLSHGNVILLTDVVYLAQPTCTIRLRGVVCPDIP